MTSTSSLLPQNAAASRSAAVAVGEQASVAFRRVLQILLLLIITLMALGAGVRTMNAGLSCPDWPLCFGKVIPDFHAGTYFEFIHRAYAGLVSIVFMGVAIYALRSPTLPRGVKVAAACGIGALILQIVMGGLTVLLLVKAVIVTGHLICATLFFCSVLAMYFFAYPSVDHNRRVAPDVLPRITGFFAILTFLQLTIGGFVASTYAGSVCVDWPLCNGQWVPTWSGAIGLQILHRFVAYFLAVGLIAYALLIQTLSRREAGTWMTRQVLLLSRLSALVVVAQVCLGVINLLWYIPPSVTVLHQTMAVLLLAVNLRAYFVARSISRGLPAPTPSRA